jgi:hypothetical protein
VRAILALSLLLPVILWPSIGLAELEVSGEKSFSFRDYGVRGDFSQFIHANSMFLNDRGFDQSLRLEVSGTINNNVYVDVSLDDSIADKSDEKLLVKIDGRVWDTTLGRINFNLPDRSFLLYNKTVLGAAIEGRLGRHRIMAFGGRPEGRSERNFFQGKGNQQEYILVDMEGYRNPEVVQGSEVVDIGGVRLVRGADYTMDYEEGTLILSSSRLPVEETSRITISFETLASGSMFQSTITGVRHEVSVDGTDWTSAPAMNEAGGYKDREYIAWSVIRDADDRSAEAAEDTSSTPGSLTLIGLDGAKSLPGGLKVTGEVVKSLYNGDTLYNSLPVEEAIAYSGAVSKKQGRYSLSIMKSRIEPGFQAIGKKTFERLGSDSDLVNDIDKTSIVNKLNIGDAITLDSVFSSSETNLANDPSKVKSDFSSQNHSLYWKKDEQGLVDLRYLEESNLITPEGVEGSGSGASSDSSLSGKERISTIVEVPVGFGLVQGSSTLEYNNDESSQTEDYRSISLGLASKAGEGKISWNGSYQINEVDVNEVMENARRTSQAALNLGIHSSSQLSADFDIKSRLEENFNDSDTTRPARLDTNTGETRVVWKPTNSLTVNFKGTVEERSRILIDDSVNDVVVDSVNDSQQTSSTIVTDNPVLTLFTSDSIEWRPSPKWDHRLSYRQRQEMDAVNGNLFSESISTDYRGKYAPSSKLRFTSDVIFGNTSNENSGTDTTNSEVFGEALYNISEAMNLKLNSKYTELDDLINDSEDEEVWEHGVSVEKELGRTFVARAGLRHNRKAGAVVSSENGFNIGVECTPDKSDLRWQLALNSGDISGTDTVGETFLSHNRRLYLSVDGKLGKMARLEGKLEQISAGADGKGGTGYSATTTELKVSVNF